MGPGSISQNSLAGLLERDNSALMSHLANFLEKISTDPALKERLQQLGATDSALDSIAALSQEYGTPVSADELRAAATPTGELSEAELDGVAGGYYGGADSFSRGLEKYYDDYVKKFGHPPPQ